MGTLIDARDRFRPKSRTMLPEKYTKLLTSAFMLRDQDQAPYAKILHENWPDEYDENGRRKKP